MLQQIISQGGEEVVIPSATDIVEVLISAEQTSTISVTYLGVNKASDFPMFTFDKPYFCIYSNDHSSNEGSKIMWGEMDDLNFTNFLERGEIITTNDGYQQESPYLNKIPTSITGLTEEAFITFHTGAADPENNFLQQSHLNMTVGGDYMHLCTWTQKYQTDGDNVFGIEAGWNHTGYSRQLILQNNKILTYHGIIADANPANNENVFQIADNGYDYVTVPNSVVTESETLSNATPYRRLDITPFYYHNTLYQVVANSEYVMIAIPNPDTYKPETFVVNLFDLREGGGTVLYYQYTIYRESDFLYLYLRDVFQGTGNLFGDWYMVRYYLPDYII